MEKNTPILETLDPEVTGRIVARRNVMEGLGRTGAKAAVVATVPLAFAALARNAFANGLPQQVVDVLNFALTLEYLEAEYYIKGLRSGVIPQGRDRRIFTTIREHEVAHVAFLKGLLGNDAVAKPTFDFTADGAFDPFGDYDTFKLLAQGFEDTGVRAYKGQAGALLPYDTVLTAALSIHSVEARHASMVRRLRGLEGWIPFDGNDTVEALMAVYEGEDNTEHAGVDASSLNGVGEEEVTESFDEPLSKEQVLAIAGMFIE